MLGQAGVLIGKIHEAGDGVQALAILHAVQVNLVLSDINMPNMNGIQLLTHLRAHSAFKTVPVIIVTTEGGEAKVMEAVHLGANGYVLKPFTADQIKKKLQGLI